MQSRPGWHQRLFAYMMANSSAEAEYNQMLARRKQALLGSLHGTVLEIGAGTAPNLKYYAPDVHWIGIDPNPAMFSYAQREAQQRGMPIELREGRAEQLDISSESIDVVVSTTVLCSVRDPAKVLQEVRRVLKPGGQFVFIEHVAAPRGTGLRRRQRLTRFLWRTFSDGCHPDRETGALIQNAGFKKVQIEDFRLAVPLLSPHIAGVAVK